MADIKHVNQINFDYNGKHYCLEYTRDTVKQMEAEGFNVNDVDSKIVTSHEQLWNGAFLAHHREDVANGVAMEIYGEMDDKFQIVETLAQMYSNTLNYLIDNGRGNIKWTVT